MLRFIKTLGTKNQPGTVIRWSSETKPAIGGLSFFIVFLFSLVIYFLLFDAVDAIRSFELMGLMVASTMAFLMGLADDAYNTRPVLKLIVQVMCGLILFFSGSSIHLFDNQWINLFVTVFWTVAIMNAINMLDNMDAIAAMVSIFIFIASLFYLGFKGGVDKVNFTLLLGLTATLLGFLFYNWYPSKIYMGDTGSQFLGVILAFCGINYGWNSLGADELSIPSRQVITVLIIFILPIVDISIVVFNRLFAGKSPFVGGKDHTTHNLGYAGLSDPQVAFTFAGISLISIVLSIYINNFAKNWTWIHILLLLLYVIIVAGILFAITRKFSHRYNT